MSDSQLTPPFTAVRSRVGSTVRYELAEMPLVVGVGKSDAEARRDLLNSLIMFTVRRWADLRAAGDAISSAVDDHMTEQGDARAVGQLVRFDQH